MHLCCYNSHIQTGSYKVITQEDKSMMTTLPGFSAELYQTEGYTGPVQVFGDAEAARLRALFFEGIGQREDNAAPTEAYLSAWHHRHRWVYDIAAHTSILDMVQAVLGPDIVMWAVHFWYKPPRSDSRIAWHQDGVYWPMQPKKNVTVWVALGPTFPANGCLRFVPGTHHAFVPHPDPSDFSVGLPDVDESRALDMAMKPGEVVLFNERTIHGSGPNVSDTPRVVLSIRFTTPDVEFLIDEWKDLGRIRTYLMRGTDRFRLNEAIRGEVPEAICAG